jgi:hypothetical protein
MRPHFDYYIASLDRWPFHVGVNLELKEKAPLKALPWRAHVRIDLNHPTADGLCTQGEEAQLYDVEDAILSRLRAGEHCFVSQVTHRSRRTMVVYVKEQPKDGDPLYDALAAIATHTAQMIECVHDPEWTEYREVLYPLPNFEHQIRDKKKLAHFEREGDDCAQLHAIEPTFIVKEPAGAEKLAAELKNAGFHVKGVTKVAEKGVKGWRVTAQVESPLALAILDDFRETWLELATKAGADYEGWNAELVPVGKPRSRKAKPAVARSRKPARATAHPIAAKALGRPAAKRKSTKKAGVKKTVRSAVARRKAAKKQRRARG